MTKIRRYLRDLFLHLISGTICHLRGRHRKLLPTGLSAIRKGFRGDAPIFQCAKCWQFYVADSAVKKFGVKP